MTLPKRMKFGIFLAPFHILVDYPALGLQRDLQLLELLDDLDYNEAWIGEQHSTKWETISSRELFITATAERTRHIRRGTDDLRLSDQTRACLIRAKQAHKIYHRCHRIETARVHLSNEDKFV